MDLQDQLRNLFPDHEPEKDADTEPKAKPDFWLPPDPVICQYEKRKGKPVTVIKGYDGTDADLKKLAGALKRHLHVGGGVRNGEITIQGDLRETIMEFLKAQGFRVKRVGG